jgi:hypothetical protein
MTTTDKYMNPYTGFEFKKLFDTEADKGSTSGQTHEIT